MSYSFAVVAIGTESGLRENRMADRNRLLGEQAIDCEEAANGGNVRVIGRPPRRPRRSVTVNLAESPLGWLLSRNLVSRRQYDAGERLRCDWERAQLSPRVTMAWDAAP